MLESCHMQHLTSLSSPIILHKLVVFMSGLHWLETWTFAPPPRLKKIPTIILWNPESSKIQKYETKPTQTSTSSYNRLRKKLDDIYLPSRPDYFNNV
jgi:hypothetical protein